ncbi:MAG: hypothetical protein K1X36_07995 [Pyrinomonadaceae bacterium]|nr:hypothetical protein [Pyrinomonadaceae bacterium]
MSLRQKVGQLFCIGIPGPELDAATVEFLQDIEPGGICLFSRNIRDAQQTRDLNDSIQRACLIPPIISLDQEGGTVDRLRRLITPIAPAGRVRKPEESRKMAELIGEIISLLGFNMNFAPVVDVVDERRSGSSNGLFTRPFGRSKDEVVDLAGTFLEVLQAIGPIGCLKHFPGLGAATVDSHEELPVVEISGKELFDVDLYPYRRLIAAGNVYAIMAAHACFPMTDLQETDQNGKLLPSSLSFNFLTRLLREELGFEGLAITDDMEMGAIVKNYGIGDACKMAFAAGIDMFAICAGRDAIVDGFEAILSAAESGEIPVERIDRSVGRVSELKSRLRPAPAFNVGRIDEISAEIARFNAGLTA